jgi:hypothetical protein
MSDGFLGRWSKRKLDAKEGKPLEDEPPRAARPFAEPQVGPVADESEAAPASASAEQAPAQPRAETPVAVPPPTLEDVQALTAESDFTRFAARGVTPDVKNAAMKKLFADPRYNVMDGLDVYTDDYSKPDPIEPSLLRKLASAKFLGLFDQEEREEEEAARRARDVADNPASQSMAQSDPAPSAVPEPPDHADPDLRLQQDHAAAGDDPGRGAG